MTVSQLRRLRWAARGVLTLAIAASITGNILHARPNPISQVISAWPPAAFLLTVELISRVPMHRRVLAAARLTATGGIAGIAAWVSYWHMAGVAARYGESPSSAYLLPLSVDGLIVVGSMSLVELAGRIRAVGEPPERVPAPAWNLVPDATDLATAIIETLPMVSELPTERADEPDPEPEPAPDPVPAAPSDKRRPPVPDRRILSVLADADLVPRRPDGTVAVDELKRRWGCGQDRAVRLLKAAGLHRSGEADPVPINGHNPAPGTTNREEIHDV